MSGRRGNGEGSVYQRRDGLWAAAITLGGGKRKTLYGKTRTAVAARLTVVLRARQQGIAIATSERLTVAAYLVRWMEGARATIRPSTHARYEVLVRRQLVPTLGQVTLAKLAPSDCSLAFSKMLASGLAPRTVIQARAVLGRALREAETDGLVARNAARLARPPRAPRAEMHTLSAADARTLIEAAKDDRLAALYAVAIASGAREGELLALRWIDVDWDRGTIRIQRTLQRMTGGLAFGEPKTASGRRSIPLGASAMDALRGHRVAQAAERLGAGGAWQDCGLVFASEVGTPIDAGNLLRRSYRPLLARAGLPRIRFHDLRHTAATLLLEAGTHPRVVAERLGHSTPSLVMNVYSHVTDRMQSQATATIDRILGAS
ncbi:MAG: tyrosine-type recombinase/integrase [Thermomicrobiales bacterium]